jgi:O-methyltransferase involved in polyketide biosynthesis
MSIDISRPQIGRIYDFVLGGTFNHEADRRAAAAMLEVMPAYPRWARQNRAFLSRVGRRWAAEGHTRVLDLGSGLPTQGHFNTHLPAARILFSDVDRLSVIQGQQLLAYSAEMAYVEADLRQATVLLEQAAEFFEDERELAVGAIGITYFLSDDHVRDLMARLHAFCAPGSVLAVSWPTVPDNPVAQAAISAAIEAARQPFWSRTPEQLAELIRPWRLVDVEEVTEMFGEEPAVVSHPDHPLHQTRVFGGFAVR